MRIALDAMGGDHAPTVTVEGAVECVRENPDLEVVLVGDEASLRRELSNKRYPEPQISIRHASEVFAMDEPPSHAIRRKKDSSIRRAFELFKNKKADAVVTAGNSGAAMALALFMIGASPGVGRPAIAATMPTFRKPFVLIDAGANVDCDPVNLFQFALMGDAYARLILQRENPRVGLLSIGEEATKGNELTKETFKLLMATDINFIGNIEGKDVFTGNADVVVCDGFVGNIVLKTSEGLAEVIIKMLKREMVDVATGRFGYLMMKSAVKNFRKKTDYAEYGGAPLLGINGTCIISHGRSTAKAIRNALRTAAEFSMKKVYETISREINDVRLSEKPVITG
jgi:glycerol-3-phosphate acyltransferase PlsX